MNAFAWFVIGLSLGACVGVVVAGLLFASKTRGKS